MKLSTDTINVLKNFAKINTSILVKPGNTLKTMSTNKTVIAKAEVKDEFPVQFAIYNLDRFLSTLSLFENPDLEFHEKQLQISDGKKKTKYTYADESIVVKPPEKEIKLPSVDVEMSLTNNDFRDVEKAASILGYTEIVVSGDKERVYLQTESTKDKTSDVHSVPVGNTDKEFKVIFKTDNLKFLPGDYKVSISDKKISLFEGVKFPFNIEYFVAVEQSSTF